MADTLTAFINTKKKIIKITWKCAKRDKFDYILSQVKTIEKRKFIDATIGWVVPYTQDNVDFLKHLGFEFVNDPEEEMREPKFQALEKTSIEKLSEKLYPHQLNGVQFMEEKQGKMLLAGDMGCIDGEAILTIIPEKGCSFFLTLKELYMKKESLFTERISTVSFNERGKVLIHNKIIDVLDKGEQESIQLEFSTGNSIKLTPDHQVLVFSPRGYSWKEAKDLVEGDKITAEGSFGVGFHVISSITPVGKIHVYDLVMEHPHHNFVANGIVVHNCGKTAQFLSYAKLHPELKPYLIVCPASLKKNWLREYKMWLSEFDKVLLAKGRTPKENLKDYDAVIINYDILDGWVEPIIHNAFGIACFDESHYLGNSGTKRTKAVKQIVGGFKYVYETGKDRAKKAPVLNWKGQVQKLEKRICMSGTPITSRPQQFFTTLNLVNDEVFYSEWGYLQRYCGPKYNGFGYTYTGATNIDELNYKLQNCMLRQKIEDVLPDLPNKMRVIVPMDLSSAVMKEYQEAEADLIDWVWKTEGPEKAEKIANSVHIVRFEKLKQLAFKAKVDSAIQWIKDYLEVEDKLVVFCTHTEALNIIVEAFKEKTVYIDGSVSQNKRQEAIDKFQTDDTIKLFVGNIKAAGVGITLTAAHATATLEFGWTPGEHDQAESRVHRIGQKSDKVLAYYLLASGTIDEEIAEVLDQKRTIITKIVDGEDVQDEALLKHLINKYKVKHKKGGAK